MLFSVYGLQKRYILHFCVWIQALAIQFKSSAKRIPLLLHYSLLLITFQKSTSEKSEEWIVKSEKVKIDKPLSRFVDFWRSGWDSNPRAVARKLISSQPRYDHFDTAAYQPLHYSINLIVAQRLFWQRNLWTFLPLFWFSPWQRRGHMILYVSWQFSEGMRV